MEKKKLLFINGHLNTGGAERSLVDLLRHLDYNRYDVDLLLLEDLGDYLAEIPQYVRVRLIDLHDTYGGFFSSIWHCIRMQSWLCLKMRLLILLSKKTGGKAFRHIRRQLFGTKKYDVAIGYRTGICAELAVFAAQAEKKIIWWHHGTYNLRGNADIRFRQCCNHASRLVAVSNACANMLQKQVPEFSEKIVTVPNLIDPSYLANRGNIYDPYPDGIGLRLVSVSRLSAEKHIENIITVAKGLTASGLIYRWTVIGDGAEALKLKQAVENAGLVKFVVFTGSLANPYPYVMHADLFIHPSYVESQGIAVLEAMALGIPCVVTRSAGPDSFIQDGVNGLLTEQNASDLAGKVLQILQDKSLYSLIRSNSHCPNRFLPEQTMNLIEKLFNE